MFLILKNYYTADINHIHKRRVPVPGRRPLPAPPSPFAPSPSLEESIWMGARWSSSPQRPRGERGRGRNIHGQV